MKQLRLTIAGAPGSGRSTVANYLADILKMNNFGVEVIDYVGEGSLSRASTAGQIIQNASKIGALGAQGVQVTIIANQTARFGVSSQAHQSIEFEVGNTYKTFGGSMVKMVERKDMSGYEAILGKDGMWRYNRSSDRGRVTGSAHDFSCPDNLIPLYQNPTPGIIEDLRIDLSLALSEVARLKKQLSDMAALANAGSCP